MKATLKSKGNEIVTLANDYEQIVHSKDVLLRQFDGALKQIKKKDYALIETSKEQEKVKMELELTVNDVKSLEKMETKISTP